MEDKVSVLIVEDEGIVAMSLEDTLKQEGYQVAGITDNGPDALDILHTEVVDLVLLDIQIKGAWDGITTARQLTTFQALPFIFLTAFSDEETVERAKDTAPSAYLLKPYQSRHLLIAIELALHNFASRQTVPFPDRTLPEKAPLPAHEETEAAPAQKDAILVFNDSIFIKQQLKFHKIRLSDICFMEAEGNYTYIHTPDRKYILRHALSRVLEKLHYPGLVRVHRSFAVNMHQLESFSDHSVFLGKREIPLGRRYKDVFFRQFDCR